MAICLGLLYSGVAYTGRKESAKVLNGFKKKPISSPRKDREVMPTTRPTRFRAGGRHYAWQGNSFSARKRLGEGDNAREKATSPIRKKSLLLEGNEGIPYLGSCDLPRNPSIYGKKKKEKSFPVRSLRRKIPFTPAICKRKMFFWELGIIRRREGSGV